MPIWRINVMSTRTSLGQCLNKGLSVDIQSAFTNPIFKGKKTVTDVSRFQCGIDIEKINALNSAILCAHSRTPSLSQSRHGEKMWL